MQNVSIVIIDPQKDFTDQSGAYARRHNSISQIQAALANIDNLLWVRGSTEVVIVYSNYRHNQFADGFSICRPGTHGHEIDVHYDLQLSEIAKTEHSAFSSEEFLSYLNRRSIKTIVLCGFLAEYCVKATALDGLASGHNVIILEDCIGTADNVQHRKTTMLAELQSLNAEIQTSSEFLP